MSAPSEPTDRSAEPAPIKSPDQFDSLPAVRRALDAAVERIQTLEGELHDLRRRFAGIRRKQAFGS